MKFGSVPIAQAVGCIAAHTVRAGGVAVRKGEIVAEEAALRLADAGVSVLVAATMEPGDIGEDQAAEDIARRVAGDGIRLGVPFTGRCNLFATHPGILVVDKSRIDALNAVDEAITLATLPAFRSVAPGEMIATIKIIPYAVPAWALAAADALVPPSVMHVAPYVRRRVGMISTRLPGLKESTIDKTASTMASRLVPTGAVVAADIRVPHLAEAVAESLTALTQAREVDVVAIFGASAIADRRDVIPSALEQIGGRIVRLGMPVDPGNLLLVGAIGDLPVLGAPGCARSPKENGFDWVLCRLLAGLPIDVPDITALGVGGLLTEITSRPQPRAGGESFGED